MSICREHSIVKGDNATRVAISLKCRSWGCDHCQPMRQKQLMAELCGGSPDVAITLTTRRVPRLSPSQAAKRLSHAWRVCRLRAIRESKRNPKKHPMPFGAAPAEGWTPRPDGTVPRMVELKDHRLPFMAVVEKHLSGWPHIHLLARAGWISWQWLSEQMRDLCDGQHVHVSRIRSKSQAAGYAAKYAGKASEKFLTTKRYWQSKDYDQREDQDPKTKPLPGHGWDVWPKQVLELAYGWKELGWEIVVETYDRCECRIRSP